MNRVHISTFLLRINHRSLFPLPWKAWKLDLPASSLPLDSSLSLTAAAAFSFFRAIAAARAPPKTTLPLRFLSMSASGSGFSGSLLVSPPRTPPWRSCCHSLVTRNEVVGTSTSFGATSDIFFPSNRLPLPANAKKVFVAGCAAASASAAPSASPTAAPRARHRQSCRGSHPPS